MGDEHGVLISGVGTGKSRAQSIGAGCRCQKACGKKRSSHKLTLHRRRPTPAHNGTYALTVWESQEEAQEAKDLIDGHACGGQCTNRHELVRLAKPSEMRSW